MKNKRTNPGAKFGNRLHRPATHSDKTKYNRKRVGNYWVEEVPLPVVRSFNMWHSEKRIFEKWYEGECEICCTPVDRYTGECPKYKCWIS